jgi:hypothetical protein
MRIRKIQLQNFRSHIDSTLELARLSVLRGTNAAGKSSIEQAIQISIAGHADGTTADGKGSIGLIRAGETKALITMALQQGDGSDERILRCALNGTACTVLVTKPDDPQYAGGEEWKDWLAMNRSVLSCLINNRYFVDLAEKDQKDVLAAIILPKTYTWPDWVKPMCHDLGLKINWAKTPFETIDQAYDVAFKERTNVNRDVKNFKMPEGDTTGHEDLEEFAQKLTTRQKELDAAKGRKNHIESDFRQRQTLLTTATQRKQEAETRLSREQQGIPTIEGRLLSAAKLKEHEKIAKGEAKASTLDGELFQIEGAIRIKKQALTELNKMSEQPSCPTCTSPITEELVQAIAKPLAEEINALSTQRTEKIEQRKSLGNPAESRKLVEEHKQADTDMTRTKERIKDEQTTIDDAQAKIDELNAGGGNVPDTSEIDAEITDLAAKIQRGTEAVNRARAARDLHIRKSDAEVERKKIVSNQASLNKLVEYFGAEGVKAELLAASIGLFMDEMNIVLAQWGYLCQISIEPYVLAIMFRDGENMPHFIQLKHLSKSQRYRFATAFQVALAIISGFKFVIVDEADIYDQQGRSGLFEALSSGELDQAIILATDERTAVPDIPDAVFYRFDNTAEDGMIPTTVVRRLLPAATQAA